MLPTFSLESLDELRTLQDSCPMEEKKIWISQWCRKNAQDVWVSPNHTFVLPYNMLIKMARFFHQQCHQGRDAMLGLFNKYWFNTIFGKIATRICETCVTCQEINVGKRVNTITSSTGKSAGPFPGFNVIL